ncbi:MAG: right-handed parallel beta-helix repeat-containing protein [Victivallales bacterium]|nr:right-handed parallel beta-helix repeat-containing protein [Victivallales bacterium]
MDVFYKNIRDFGAVGDGVTNDTAAIQRALDSGGAVYVPGGTYRTGTLYLRSNGGLHLASDAVLMGSPDPADYNSYDSFPQNWKCDEEQASGAHLIVALECENVFIGGNGRIWGNREAFFDPLTYPYGSRTYFTGWRPSQMILFCECKNVSVSDVILLNSPYWSLMFMGCDDVRVRGLDISNMPWQSWNGDGIAIDCCHNVTVSDSIVRSSDDGVTVRASVGKHLKKHDDVCENIAISNCVMLGHSGIRYGVGSGTIRNCSASNLTIKGGLRGIGIHQSYETKLFPDGARGCQVENITLSNLTIDCQMPFYLTATTPPTVIQPSSQHQIRGISYNNIRARGWLPMMVSIANEDMNIHDVSMTDCTFQIHDGPADVFAIEQKDILRGWARYYEYGMYFENVRDVMFRNVRVAWENEVKGWKSALCMKNTHEMTFHDCRFDAPCCGTDVIRL